MHQQRAWRAEDLVQRSLDNARAIWARFVEKNRWAGCGVMRECVCGGRGCDAVGAGRRRPELLLTLVLPTWGAQPVREAPHADHLTPRPAQA